MTKEEIERAVDKILSDLGHERAPEAKSAILALIAQGAPDYAAEEAAGNCGYPAPVAPEIFPEDTTVLVKPMPTSTWTAFIGTVSGNGNARIKDGKPFGWYWVVDEMGREHEVLAELVERAEPVKVIGYND